MGDPTVAIIAGEGVLPRMLSEALSRAGRTHIACYPHGLEVEVPAAEEFFFERSIAFIKSLQQRGIQQIVMVGKFVRPRSLNLLRFEGSTLMAAPRILASLRNGDDASLRALAQIQGWPLQEVLLLAVAEPGWGERLTALVRPAEPANGGAANGQALIAALQAAVAAWPPAERPRQWLICQSLAPSPQGKWLRGHWQRWLQSLEADQSPER
jgi:hypothetical protein